MAPTLEEMGQDLHFAYGLACRDYGEKSIEAADARLTLARVDVARHVQQCALACRELAQAEYEVFRARSKP